MRQFLLPFPFSAGQDPALFSPRSRQSIPIHPVQPAGVSSITIIITIHSQIDLQPTPFLKLLGPHLHIPLAARLRVLPRLMLDGGALGRVAAPERELFLEGRLPGPHLEERLLFEGV